MEADRGTAWAEAFLGPTGGLERMGLAAATGLVLVLVLCPLAIRLFRRLHVVEWSSKTDSPEIADRHQPKNGTPTMGGLVLVAGGLAAAALWAEWDGVLLPSLAGVFVLFGLIGALDDLVKIRHPSRKGLGSRLKLALMGGVALLAATVLYAHLMARHPEAGIVVQVPFLGGCLPVGPFFVVLAAVVLTGSANAVNLTDGLDGLATGLLVLAFSAFAVLGFLAGAVERAASAGVFFVPAANEVAVFAAALAGVGLGFLVFNRHPARVFMGDTGALAMGGALGAIALVIRQELLLLVVGGVFVAEALSVILQVWYFRRCGRRIFRCAPLHHHFEIQNWPETRITRSFWLAGAVLSAAALAGTLGGG